MFRGGSRSGLLFGSDRAEELLDAQARILEKIATAAPLDEALDTITMLVESLGDGILCSVLLVDESGTTVRHGSAPSLPDDYVRAVDGLQIGPTAGSCGTAAFRNEPVIVTDIATDPLWNDYRHLALPHGLRACWSTPIRSATDGRVLGTFAMYYREPRAPGLLDEELVALSVHLAAIAIDRVYREKSLRESEEVFRGIFHHAPAGISNATTDGRFLRANAAFHELVGYSADELRTMSFRDLTHPDDLQGEMKLFEELLAGLRDTYRIEKRYVTKDGSVVWVDLAATLVRSEDGTPLFGIRMTQDITERKRLEEQLIHSQRMEALGRLAGGIAHDFNNLLQVIVTSAENLPQDDPNSASSARLIQWAAEDGARLVTQLLAYARKQVIRPTEVCPNHLLLDSSELVARVLGEEVQIAYELDDSVGNTLIDRGQFSQTFINLIMNAREAMPGGGRVHVQTRNVTATVEKSWHGGTLPPGDYISVGVTDTGRGIDSDAQPYVFEPFFTTKPLVEGSGLGLSMVYGIVTQAGGAIFIDSTSVGTKFEIYLPRVEGS